MRLSAAIAAACFSLTLAAASEVEAAIRRSTQIPAQGLGPALQALARQRAFQIVYLSEVVDRLQTAGVVGELTTAEALTRLLEGTGLEYRYLDDKTVTVFGAESDAGDPASPPATQSSPSGNSPERIELDEVIVTGTHIRGVQDSASPMLIFDRDAIERTGFSSVNDLLESIPQNFGGGANGASEDGLSGAGALRLTNFSAATGANLRGLGNVATLVLVNGHRLAPSAMGQLVDTSMLPLSAIERVEILTDGSSAVYGSDAIGGVVNIILRRDYEGAESRLRFGATTDDGPQERLAAQSVGGQWDGGSALLALQFRDRGSLRAEDRDFSAGRVYPAELLPSLIQRNAAVSAQHDFGSLDVFGDVLFATKDTRRLYVQNSVQAGNTTFSSAVENTSATVGTGYDFPVGEWRAEATFSRGQDDTRHRNISNFPSVSYPVLSRYEFALETADLKLYGRLFELPGGPLRLAVGGTYREEQLHQVASSPTTRVNRTVSRDIRSAFAELYVPVIGARNAVPAARRLEVSLAARYDDYSDFGSTDNPKFGVLWSPLDSLDVRATYSTSFRAPNSSELISTSFQDTIIATRALAPTGAGQVPIFVLGGSESLGPEESENLTAGLTLTPPILDGLSLSLNYYEVDYTDRIFQPVFLSSALRNQNVYGAVIDTLADDAQAQAFLNAQVAAGAAFNNQSGTGASGVRYIFNARARNVAALEQTGFDIIADYRVGLGEHRLSASLNMSLMDRIDVQLAAGAMSSDIVDTYGNPLGGRYRADLGWGFGGFQANLAVNRFGSYTDNAAAVRASVDSWTTMDVSLRYSPERGGWLQGCSVQLSAINVLDEDPPFAAGSGLLTYSYDAANADPLGRFIAVELRKMW